MNCINFLISLKKKNLFERTELAEDYKNRMEAMNEELGNKNQEREKGGGKGFGVKYDQI